MPDNEPGAPEPDRLDSMPGHGKDFGVSRGPLSPDALDADVGELAVLHVLGLLVPKSLPGVLQPDR